MNVKFFFGACFTLLKNASLLKYDRELISVLMKNKQSIKKKISSLNLLWIASSSMQALFFLSGYPSKYGPGSLLFNFGDLCKVT